MTLPRFRVLGALFALLASFPLASPSAQLGFTAFGPVNAANGFPAWYRDARGVSLDPCLTDPIFCGLGAAVTLSAPGQPFPLNFGGTFPEEFFYSLCSAKMPTNGGGTAILVIGLEGAFLNGPVAAGGQITFGRVRIRVGGTVSGGTYRVTTPVGAFTFVATPNQTGINFTDDIGGVAGGDFTTALGSHAGPFLSWDVGLPLFDAAGREYVGTPAIDHTITGSPSGTNFFQIDGPSIGGPGINRIRTNLFSVIGLKSVPPPVANFTATPLSGNAPLTVAFTDTSTGAITSRSWSFGDGGTSTLPSPTHTYVTNGSFTVSLTVTGPGGSNTKTSPGLITVGAPAAPVLALAEPNPGRANVKNTFTVTGTSNNGLVFLIGSPTLGTSAFNQAPCGLLVTGLAAPKVMANKRAVGTTATFEVGINGSLLGLSFSTQVVDIGRCAVSNVNTHVY